MPRTTASLLRVDYVHRAQNPLDPKLRAEMRFVAAHANHCPYAEEYALADGRRAGLDEKAIDALRRGDYSGNLPAEKNAIEFARKMTVSSASITDQEFAALVKQYDEKSVAAMVLTMAYANFQDRVLLCLGSPLEADGPLPPLDVVFASGALVSLPSAITPRKPSSTSSSAAAQTSAGDVVQDDPEWSSVSFEELQQRLERQRQRSTRVRVPEWEEVEPRAPCQFHHSQSRRLELGLPGSSARAGRCMGNASENLGDRKQR